MPKESVIKHFSSSTTGNVPSSGDLVGGELAINTADEKVFFKNLAGNVVSLGASKDISGAYSAKGHTHGISDISNATTVGSSFVTLANPSAVTYPVINADNTVSALTADAYRRSIGVIIPVTVGTAAATAAKVGTTQFGNDVPAIGDTFAVTFTLGNSVSTATLAIDGTAVRNIRLNNANVNTSTFSLNAGATVIMYFDGTYYQVVGSQDTSDDTEDANMRWNQGIRVGDTVTRVKLMMQGTDGKFYPISIGDSTSANAKTISTVEFLLNGNILYYGTTTTLAPDATTTSAYSEINVGSNFAYTANQISDWTAFAPVYLKGTVNANGNFVLDNTTLTSFMTQTLPSSEDGFVYILFGYMYNTTTSFRLIAQHPIYEYKGGRIRQYVPNLQGDDITSGTIANARTTATASNVNDAIVARDGSGNFSAGTITASLSGSATQLGGTAANSWALQSWVTSGLNGKASTTGSNASGTWPINITGNAATATTASSANQVANALTIGTGLGGGASYNGSSAVTIANTGVLSLNGLTGARTLTGDGGALAGVGNDTIRARLATTSLTGVASFNSSRFAVNSAGQVDSLGVYSVAVGGATLTGSVSLTSGTNITLTPSGSTITIAGAASGVTTTAANTWTATQNFNAGISASGATFSGNISAPNIVTSLNGLAGARTLTGDGGAISGVGNDTIRARLATTSLTGVASFNSNRFAVNSAGQVDSLQVYSFNGLTGVVTYAPPVASAGASGVASFSNINFTVSATGAVSISNGGVPNAALANSTISGVSLGSNLNALTIGTGLGGGSYNGSAAVTISNTGVTSFNGATGAILYAPPVASAGASGVASFQSGQFTVSATGHVSLASTVTGDTVVAGGGIGVSRSANVATINNLGVTLFNGLTGAVSLTGDGGALAGVGNNTIRARLASTSLTGVASFSSSDFGVSSTGHVSLTGNVARTNVQNQFTSFQRFNAGLSAAGGLTFVGGSGAYVSIPSNQGLVSIDVGEGNFYVGDVGSQHEAPLISIDGIGHNITLDTRAAPAGEGRLHLTDGYNSIIVDPILGVRADPEFTTPTLNANTINASNIVNSLNGLTGARTLTGDGGALAGVGNDTIRARLATTSLTGVASFNSSRFAVNSAGQVDSLGVYSVAVGGATLTGSVSITAGSNIILTPSGSTITIAGAAIGNGTLTLNTSGVGLTGSQTFTANQSGNATFTVTSNATSANTANAIVSRDANGDFTSRYINASYFNHSHSATYRGTDTDFYSSTDAYIRKNTKAGFLASLGLTNTASANTAGAIVVRDGSGNFSAGTITASLSGSATQLGGTAANLWALQSWVTTGLNGKASTTGNNATGTWPISITGNAATATTASSANQVANALSIGTGLGGGSSYNGSAAVTITNTGVLSLNGLTGARTLTGDGGALAGVGNDTIRARLATTSLTGVASFNSSRFAVNSAGQVDSLGMYSIAVGGATLTGSVSLTSGSNITLTPSGSTITIASTASGGGATTTAANTWTATQTFSGGINVSAGATFSGSVESNTGYRVGAGAINAQTAGYTLVAGDNGKIITLDSASNITLTAGTAVGTTGFSCTIIQLGTGQARISASGVTLNSYSGLTMAGQHAAATMFCYATNTFNVAGNLTT